MYVCMCVCVCVCVCVRARVLSMSRLHNCMGLFRRSLWSERSDFERLRYYDCLKVRVNLRITEEIWYKIINMLPYKPRV